MYVLHLWYRMLDKRKTAKSLCQNISYVFGTRSLTFQVQVLHFHTLVSVLSTSSLLLLTLYKYRGIRNAAQMLPLAGMGNNVRYSRGGVTGGAASILAFDTASTRSISGLCTADTARCTSISGFGTAGTADTRSSLGEYCHYYWRT